MAGINSQSSDSDAIHNIIEFPAEYGIKIMGLDESEFDGIVKNILTTHLNNNQSVEYSYKKSGKEKYISITCTFIAKSRLQLDQIYTEIRAHPKVLMVL